jgi:ProP effector
MSEVNQNDKVEVSTEPGKSSPASNQQNSGAAVQKKYSPREVLDFLIERFPKCFFPYNSESVRPIKIGILEDIVARLGDEISPESKYSKTAIRQGIKVYASSLAYFDSCKVGARRVDLDGNECDEPISEEQEKYAQERREAVKKRISEKQSKNNAARDDAQNRKSRPSGDGFKKKRPSFRNSGGRDFNKAGGKKFSQQKKPYTRPPVYDYLIVDMDTLKVGDFVSVRIAQGLARGFVDKIESNDIHVKMRNGNIVHTQISSLRKIVRKDPAPRNDQMSEN